MNLSVENNRAIKSTASKQSLQWLLGQAKSATLWVGLSVGLGWCGGLLLIVQAWCLSRIVHGVAVGGVAGHRLWLYFSVLIAVAVIKSVLAWGRTVSGFKAGATVREQVRREIIQHITRLGPAYTTHQKSGALSSTVMEHVEGLHGFFADYLPQLALAVAIPASMLAFVFPISWAAGGLFLITAPLIPFFMVLIGMGAQSISQRYFIALSRMSGHFLDVLQGLPTLKLFDRSRSEEKRVARVSGVYRKQTMKVLRVAFLSSAVLEFFCSISIAIVAVYLGMSFLGYYEFGSWGTPLTLASGFFILLLAPEFYLPLRELGTHYHTRAEAIGAAEEILKILNVPLPAEPKDPIPWDAAERIGLCFQDIHLAYQDGRRPALNGVSFDLKAGEKVIIVGESGAGKTSLFQLLLGFFPLDQGHILANGISIADVSISRWRRYFSWIGQDPTLFYGTIRANIHMGKPNAPDIEVDAAARYARVLEFADQLPEGMETMIGERGYGLSRGQAQRIALARAYLKSAPVLLLDEPTAGLDPDNEKLIFAALETISKDRTVLMLTHRLTGIEKADRILVLAHGKIAEQGTYPELISARGEFYRLVNRGKFEKCHHSDGFVRSSRSRLANPEE